MFPNKLDNMIYFTIILIYRNYLRVSRITSKCPIVRYFFIEWSNDDVKPTFGGTPYGHHNDIIMSASVSRITGLTVVESIVYSRRSSKRTSKLCLTGLCKGNSPVTSEFPTQRASYAEYISIWWRHHARFNTQLKLPIVVPSVTARDA